MIRLVVLIVAVAFFIGSYDCSPLGFPPSFRSGFVPSVRSGFVPSVRSESSSGLAIRSTNIPPPTTASPSCLSFRQCKKDSFFLSEVRNFSSIVRSRYPDVNLPKDIDLLKHFCSLLDNKNGAKLNLPYLLNWKKSITFSMDELFAMFLHPSYWLTEEGTLPYRNPIRPPMWWCFLASNAIYTAGSTYSVYGGPNIILSFSGLGIDTLGYLQGAGLYVSSANLTDVYAIKSPRRGYLYSFSFCNKELVNTNFSPFTPRGTVKPLDTYGLFMEIKDYRISRIIEFINEIPTLLWAGYQITVPSQP